MQHIELRDGPGQERKVENREVEAHVRQFPAPEDHFVDDRLQPGFRADGRIEEVLKGRGGPSGLLRIHGESGYNASIGFSLAGQLGETPDRSCEPRSYAPARRALALRGERNFLLSR